MTTDTTRKLASRTISLGGAPVTIAGLFTDIGVGTIIRRGGADAPAA
jgi:hypothetical protein